MSQLIIYVFLESKQILIILKECWIAIAWSMTPLRFRLGMVLVPPSRKKNHRNTREREGSRTVNLHKRWPNRIIQNIIVYVNNSHN